jgi:hypothetical protein
LIAFRVFTTYVSGEGEIMKSNRFLVLFSVFVFAWSAKAGMRIEDGVEAPTDDSVFQPYDYAPEDTVDLPDFDSRAFQERLIEDLPAEFDSIVFGLFKKRQEPEAAATSVQGSQLVADVYKRLADFPEFVVVRANGKIVMVSVVSTAKAGKLTRAGTYRSFHQREMRQRSSLYNNAPMPYAQFFNGNIGFHGTVEENYPKLGGIASAGCVRLQVPDAKRLWDLVNSAGRANTITRVHESGDTSFEDGADYEYILRSVNQSLQKRDSAIEAFAKDGSRSVHWPSGFYKKSALRHP